MDPYMSVSEKFGQSICYTAAVNPSNHSSFFILLLLLTVQQFV
uniref:Uncharacterized protein n=1 Tax=Arundo donax TaxID=35708 RepID=A0A0A8YGN2_ARUDO